MTTEEEITVATLKRQIEETRRAQQEIGEFFARIRGQRADASLIDYDVTARLRSEEFRELATALRDGANGKHPELSSQVSTNGTGTPRRQRPSVPRPI